MIIVIRKTKNLDINIKKTKRSLRKKRQCLIIKREYINISEVYRDGQRITAPEPKRAFGAFD